MCRNCHCRFIRFSVYLYASRSLSRTFDWTLRTNVIQWAGARAYVSISGRTIYVYIVENSFGVVLSLCAQIHSRRDRHSVTHGICFLFVLFRFDWTRTGNLTIDFRFFLCSKHGTHSNNDDDNGSLCIVKRSNEISVCLIVIFLMSVIFSLFLSFFLFHTLSSSVSGLNAWCCWCQFLI